VVIEHASSATISIALPDPVNSLSRHVPSESGLDLDYEVELVRLLKSGEGVVEVVGFYVVVIHVVIAAAGKRLTHF